jgi:hypothetical protein
MAARKDLKMSIALALCTPDRAILASDSRTWDTRTDQSGGDVARKVDVRDGFAFLMTGGPVCWHTWHDLRLHPHEPAVRVAERLLAAVPTHDETEFTFGIVRFAAPPENILSETILPEIFAVKARIVEGRVEVLQHGAPEAPAAICLGWNEGGSEKTAHVRALHHVLTSRPSETAMRQLVEDTLQMAARQSRKVGGPSHVAILDASGARWHCGGPVAAPSIDRRAFALHCAGALAPLVAAPLLHWTGTELTVVSGSVTIDDDGIHIAPGTSENYDAARSYDFSVATGNLGMHGNDSATGRFLNVRASWSGSDGRPAMSFLSADYAGSTGNPSAANVQAFAEASSSTIFLSTSVDSVSHVGSIAFGGIPNFLGATSGSAGAIVGYLNVRVGGTNYRIPYLATS